MEFYDKTNGLEVSCGKGESRRYDDAHISSKQYSKLGDQCVCLVSNNKNKYNYDIFECSPRTNCEYDDECIETIFNDYMNENDYMDNLRKCMKHG